MTKSSASAETSVVRRFLEIERKKWFYISQSKFSLIVFSSTLCMCFVYIQILAPNRRHKPFLALLGDRSSYSYFFHRRSY